MNPWVVAFFIVTIGFHAGRAYEMYFPYGEPTPMELAAEYQGYRDCLEYAGKMRCQMTPQDFVRYYELKLLLETAR